MVILDVEAFGLELFDFPTLLALSIVCFYSLLLFGG